MTGSAPRAFASTMNVTALPVIGSILLCAPDMGVN
jgi:hypothetical protein